MSIPEAAQRAAEAAYTEKLVELRLAEGGGFKVASQQRRAIAFALEAAAPRMLAGAWEEGRLVGRAEERSGFDTEMNPYVR